MSAILDAHCGSVFWDWSIVWDTDTPDFTKCFQKTVLIWIPCGFLCLCLPFEIYSQKNHTTKCIPWTVLNITKFISSICLAALSMTELFYWIYMREAVYVASANCYSNIIKCFSFIITSILILNHRQRGRRSSDILFIFWLLLTISTTVTFRSFLMSLFRDETINHQLPSLCYLSLENLSFMCCIISYPLIVMQLVLSVISDKISVESTQRKKQCPIKDATLLSRYLFAWFDKMCYLGFRRPLTKDDLWDLLDEYRCSIVYPNFLKNWNLFRQKQSLVGKSPSILSALRRTFWIPFALTGLVQLGANLTDFTTPFVLTFLIDFVSNDEPHWRGYFYCCLILLMGFLATFFYTQQYWIAEQLSIKVRASLISAIYKKAIRMNSNIKNASSTGEIVNLMSIDTVQLCDVLFEFHTCWIIVLEVSLCFYFLWIELGIASLAGFVTLVVMGLLNVFITRRLKHVQTEKMNFKDQRVKLMNEVLASIKILKLYAWEIFFGLQINAIRNKELKMLKKNANITAIVEFLFGVLPTFVTLSTFITYTLIDKNNEMNAKKIFISISLFNILYYPMTLLPRVIVTLVQALVSAKRLNKFLNQEELDQNAVSHHIASKDPIVIENGNFAWTSDSENILREINLTCPHGHLIGLLGSVGCGKSSLLCAILGEMEKRSGNVNVKGEVAYVDQQAWIQNATIRDNILFGSSYNEHRYDEVIEACALKADLKILPAGDLTEIGERGVNLSGGQKQRISLARAAYSNADIFLLDSPLSAVDSHVGKHIFDHVIGPNGLLKNKTRLFVTNSIVHLPQLDSIVVLNKGEVNEVGSYDELLKNKGAFADFLINYLTECNSELIKKDQLTNIDCIREEVDCLKNLNSKNLKYMQELANCGTSLGLRQRIRPNFSQEKTESVELVFENLKMENSNLTQEKSKLGKSYAKRENNAKLIDLERTETGQVHTKIYIKYFRAVGIRLILACIAALTLSKCCHVAANTWLSLWSQDFKTSTTNLRIQRLIVYVILEIGEVILMLISCFTLANGFVQASRNLHNSMLESILRCPLSFFETTPLGRILNRFSKDINLVDVKLAKNIHPTLHKLLEIIAIIFVLTINTPLVLTAILPIFIIYYIVQIFYISSSRQLKRLESTYLSPIICHFTETLFGTRTIRAYNRTGDFITENEFLVDEHHKCHYLHRVANRWLAVRLALIGSFISFSAALFAVSAKGTFDSGVMGLTVSSASTIGIKLIILVRTIGSLETNIVSVERISEYIDVKLEAPAVIENKCPDQDWPQEGVIKFNEYETSYREGLDVVLKEITCEIHKEEKIGIVGRTGAGKSSFALALFRIIEPTRGNIVIDGVDITKLGLTDLRSRLTIIPQDPVLFCGSLRMNLDPFEKYSDFDVSRALKHSHLRSFVSSLPDGLQHKIRERGENLSMGQRQLVCLARALLRKSKILVLDEATAAVDLETDDLIQATIRKEFADCTVITIAHRLNTIMDSTRIMVLDQGKIKEFDSPITLLRDTKSMFYSLAKDAGLI